MTCYQLTKPLIDTTRLTLREFCLEDAKAVLAFNSDKRVLKYVPGDDLLETLDDAKSVIKDIWQKEYQRYGYARYALVLKELNSVIGFCGFKFEPQFGYPDLGYRIAPEYWGRGIVSEAVNTLMHYNSQVLKLEKIVAAAAVDNIASNKILLKVGFKQKLQFIEMGMPHFYYEYWQAFVQ